MLYDLILLFCSLFFFINRFAADNCRDEDPELFPSDPALGPTLIVVVVYQGTIAAIGHGLLKKFWPFGNMLRSAHCR